MWWRAQITAVDWTTRTTRWSSAWRSTDSCIRAFYSRSILIGCERSRLALGFSDWPRATDQHRDRDISCFASTVLQSAAVAARTVLLQGALRRQPTVQFQRYGEPRVKAAKQHWTVFNTAVQYSLVMFRWFWTNSEWLNVGEFRKCSRVYWIRLLPLHGFHFPANLDDRDYRSKWMRRCISVYSRMKTHRSLI